MTDLIAIAFSGILSYFMLCVADEREKGRETYTVHIILFIFFKVDFFCHFVEAKMVMPCIRAPAPKPAINVVGLC